MFKPLNGEIIADNTVGEEMVRARRFSIFLEESVN
jgi:hypothetical protein